MPQPPSPFTQDKTLLLEALHHACNSVGLGTIAEAGEAIAAVCGSLAGDAELDRAAERIAGMDLGLLAGLVRVGAARFHLLNKAEQLNIIRVNRSRERSLEGGSCRPESIDAAMATLTERGLDAKAIAQMLGRLDIGPTLTAHPTETRRRTVLDKQADIAASVSRLSGGELTAREAAETRSRLDRAIALLLTTDEVRQERLDVPAEVRNGVYFLRTTIWRAVPRLVRDVAWAARQTFGDDQSEVIANDLPALIRYRSWIGGDRDGNPNVTADVTERTIAVMREAARELWAAELERLHDALSVSIESVGGEPGSPHEPLRVMINQVAARMDDDSGYDSAALLEDLHLIRRRLLDSTLPGLHRVAEEGLLADAITRAKSFGLHLASLDIRQHSRVHAKAVGELLRTAGVETEYETLDEAGKLRVLRQELTTDRPLVRDHDSLSEASAELMATLRVVREAQQRDPRTVACWVISMTSHVSDLLAVILLMRESGVRLPIVPLFETVDDLDNAPRVMDHAFAEPCFREYVEATSEGDPEQEIMLGYSDSNKDGGFVSANVALHLAQQRIAEVFTKHGVGLRYFHGRGGTTGRGGGRAGRAILAAPPASRSGRLRFTEQGEIITFRYALAGMARRHLEQIVHAAMLAEASRSQSASIDGAAILAKLAANSQRVYRELIDDDAFWPWFIDCSPVEHIGGLPIASRPVSRATGDRLKFENLRAIPWVFSWIQMRAMVPGWYGLGSALRELDDADRNQLRSMCGASAFLGTVLENANQEMARARLPVFRRYALRSENGEAIFSRLESEFGRTRAASLDLTGHADLMEHAPVVGRSIDARNPWTDVLNLVQIELLGRSRLAGGREAEAIRPVLHASINAIAAAMQSTG
ncbi:MAG: phosphoenolpyruvate carboxylase [Planctomycetota bacterium]